MAVKGKVVFLTGAARGLGQAFTEVLLQHGAKVFFVDVDEKCGMATLADFQKRFGSDKVRFAALNVTDHCKFQETFQQAVAVFGHVDIMVNNAGILHETKWELMININFTAVVCGTKLAIQHMRKDTGGQGGRIINVSSEAGLRDGPLTPVYCGTKHAVRSFTSSLALQPNCEELGLEYGILCPRSTTTDLHLKLDSAKVPFMKEFNAKNAPIMMERSTVAEAFLELVQRQKLNGDILWVHKQGTTYRRYCSVAI